MLRDGKNIIGVGPPNFLHPPTCLPAGRPLPPPAFAPSELRTGRRGELPPEETAATGGEGEGPVHPAYAGWPTSRLRILVGADEEALGREEERLAAESFSLLLSFVW